MAMESNSKYVAVMEAMDCNRAPIKDFIKDDKLSANAALLTETFELTGSIRDDVESVKSNDDDDFFIDELSGDDTESLTSFCYSSSEGNELSEKSFEMASTPSVSPTPRTMGSPTLEDLECVAFSERVKRLSDCMLAGVVVGDKLKRKVGSGREQQNQSTVSDAELSDSVTNCVTEGSFGSASEVTPTHASSSWAAERAYNSCMQGYYFDNVDGPNVHKLKRLYKNSLNRVSFSQGEYLLRQNEKVDKLFVIEEGNVEISCDGQVAGKAGSGSILGELSLVYGIPALADVECISPRVIAWTMDVVAFRQVLALVSEEPIEESMDESQKERREEQLTKLVSQLHTFADIQIIEEGKRLEASCIPFEHLSKLAVVGKGGHGWVYAVEDTSTESLYSLKSMSKTEVVKLNNLRRLYIEKHALRDLADCPFIISLIGTYQDEDSLYFLTDFVAGGNLMTYMVKRDILSHEECLFFAANLVSALLHLHSKGYVHRDIKPENCVIGKDGYLKLCDFGLSKRLPTVVRLPSGGIEVLSRAFTQCGTSEFLAPEVLFEAGYNKNIDWWALGCIIVEMYCGKSPFDFHVDQREAFWKVFFIGTGEGMYVPPTQMEEAGLEHANDFTQKLLAKESDRLGRNDTCEIREHAYFSEIDFEKLREKVLKAPYVPMILGKADTSLFDVHPGQGEEEVEPFCGDNEIFYGF